MSWQAEFHLTCVREQKKLDNAIWYDVAVIGDRAPLAWSGAALPLHKKTLPDGVEEWIGNARIEEDEPLRYRYLVRELRDNGRIYHHIEGNLGGVDRIKKWDMPVRADVFQPAIELAQNRLHSRAVCEAPWRSPVVGADGQVTVCCTDDEFKLCIGDLRYDSLGDIWNCRQARLTRLWHIRGEFRWLPTCNGCVHWRERPLPDIEIYRTLEEHGVEAVEWPAYLRRKRGIRRRKRYLLVELSDICPLKCRWCNQIYERWEDVHALPEKGLMRADTFYSLLASAVELVEEQGYPFASIGLFWLGEPLVHPKFCDFLLAMAEANVEIAENFQFPDMAAAKPVKLAERLEIHTNGVLFQSHHLNAVRAAASLCPVTVVLSLDANAGGTYAYCKGLSDIRPDAANRTAGFSCEEFDRATEAGRMLLDCLCAEMRSNSRVFRNLRVVLQIIACPDNEQEVTEFAETWAGESRRRNLPFQTTMYYDFAEPVVIFIRKMDKIDPDSDASEADKSWQLSCERLGLSDAVPEKWIPESPPQRLGRGKPFCAQPWEMIVVRRDGAVTPCCHDTAMKLNAGNLNDSSLKQIINGEKLAGLREGHVLGRPPEICRQCMVRDDANMHGADEMDVLDWLFETRRTDMIAPWLTQGV